MGEGEGGEEAHQELPVGMFTVFFPIHLYYGMCYVLAGTKRRTKPTVNRKTKKNLRASLRRAADSPPPAKQYDSS